MELSLNPIFPCAKIGNQKGSKSRKIMGEKEMILHISEPYLWLPVNKKNSEVKLHFYCNNTKFQEVDIQLGGTDGDFYTSMDVSRYLGQDVEIKGDIPQDMFYHIFCYKEEVQNVYPFRPQIHFVPQIGWHNDPNGLVYADGVYHLYYQWNPFGVVWGNMHWGHAVSKDLIKWEHRPMVMEPDQYGTIYSGCGWQDKENAAGFGENTLLFFYTASGGCNQWSVDVGNQHTQRLAISTDGGETLQCIDGAILPHITGENRDPKIFYHKESAAYIMVLFLDEYEFAVFRSTDLLHWEETQRFSAEKMRECPDLFELSVDNDAEEKKWVFWSADGYYLVGSFDGYHFTPESEVLSAYSTITPYAAQTYAGVKDRIISLAWLRLANDRGNYRGAMSLPTQLSLVKTDSGYKLSFHLLKEFLSYRQLYKELEKGEKTFETELKGTAVEITLNWKAQEIGYTKLIIGDTAVTVNFDKGNIEFLNSKIYSEVIVVPFDKKESLNLDFIIDQEVIEFLGNNGLIYGAVETEENVLRKNFVMESAVELESMRFYEITTKELFKNNF